MQITNLYLLILMCSMVAADSIIHIGAIFEESASKDQEAFVLAVRDLNANGEILQSEQITYSIRTVDGNNPFHALQEACELMEQGILALLSSTGCAAASSLQALAEAMRIPYLFVEQGGVAGPGETGGCPRSGCELPTIPTGESEGYTLTVRPSSQLGHLLAQVIDDFAWRKFILFYENGYDIRGVREFLEHTSRRGAEVSLQRVDSSVGAMIATLFRSLKIEELNRYRDTLRRAVLLLSPRLARTLLAKTADANLIAGDSHWIYVNEEVSSAEIQDLALVASGRITVLRQAFPAPQQPSQYCIRNRHHISPQLCNPQDPAYSVPKVSSRYIYDSVILLSMAFHQKLEDRKWHSMASLNCLKKWTKPWNGGSSMLHVIKQGRVQGLSGVLEFNEEGVNPNVQFEILGTSYGDGWEKTIKRLAMWDPKNGLNGTLKDRQLENNLRGVSLKVVSVLEAPFVMVSENVLGQPRHFMGFSLDVLGLLAAQLGFTFSVHEAPGNEYGHPHPDGSWSGLLGEIMSKHADVGVGALTVTPERESVVDFTRRYLDRGLAMTVRETKDSVDLFSCLMAFRPLLWAGVALSAIIVALVLQRLNGSCSNVSTGHAASSSLSSWASSLWLVFGSLMQQGGEPLLTSISARVMLAVWWFFTLIVVSSYTASLAAFLTLSRLTTPIGSLQELVRQTDVTFGTVLHSALYEQLRMRALNPASPEHSTYAHLWTTVSRNNGSENCVRDVAEGLARVKRGGYIFLWDTAVLEHEALNDGDCALSVRNVAYDKGYSLALQQGSPYRDIFSQRLLELQESGELEALRQKWWPRQTGKCDPYGSPMSPARPQGLDLPGLAGAFALLAAGLLLACLLGACELCWSSRPHHLCPPKVQEDKELEMQQVRQRLGSVERLHEMAAASRKPLALLPGESPCGPDSPAEHGREYRTLGFAIGSFLMDDKATGRPMAVGGPGPSMTGSQPPSQPPPPLPVPLCAHSITEPLLGHGKQRAPNGGLQRQSPLKAFGRTSFHMPVDYISEGLCEPLHGTSI